MLWQWGTGLTICYWFFELWQWQRDYAYVLNYHKLCSSTFNLYYASCLLHKFEKMQHFCFERLVMFYRESCDRFLFWRILVWILVMSLLMYNSCSLSWLRKLFLSFCFVFWSSFGSVLCPLVRVVFLVGVVLVVFAGCYLLFGVWLLVCVTAVLVWCAQLECLGSC